MNDYWVWGGSPIKGEDGRYHLFVSRWPKRVVFFNGYKIYSEIVRATSDTPAGPYQFAEVVLPARGEEFWDGRMTHNPAIRKFKDTYLLFYIGSTFKGEPPTDEELKENSSPKIKEAYNNIRIGLATSKSILGPWERKDAPVLDIRPDKWDKTVVTNPAPCVLDDGSILLVYRSNTPEGLRLGIAKASHFSKPFLRISDIPIFQFDNKHFCEDPFIWWNGKNFEVIMKDMTGKITGEFHAGVHATSTDGINWVISNPAKAYSRTIHWEDGRTTTQGSFERPQLLFNDRGIPTHLFTATGDGPGGFQNALNTWCMVVPLE
ncbi:glycoside hydrolase family protein [candidate division KSB1 bacterium]|nr:glycoside hydrolase family protein [candidate division KSB1 bacterium]